MNNKSYEIRWSFTSSLGEVHIERYYTPYRGEVYEIDEELGEDQLIGKVSVDLIHIALASNNETINMEEVFDLSSEIQEIAGLIMNPEEFELNEDILEYYEDNFNYADLCIIQRIVLIASHRNKGIGRKVIKDIFNRFYAASQLFVLKTYPIQFESTTKNIKEQDKTEWDRLLDLKALDSDFEKAFYQLKAFYQKVGFEHIDGYDELMFLNPAINNQVMDKIEFDL